MAVRPAKFALYLDTSALIKLFIEEDASAKVRALAVGRMAADLLLASRLGYTEVERYGSTGLSAIHGRWRWHFYSVAVVEREAAKARTVRRIGH